VAWWSTGADLTAEEYRGKPFDLVHARALVEHPLDREKILERLARWGAGWVVGHRNAAHTEVVGKIIHLRENYHFGPTKSRCT
jgi:hypothetical protein